MTCLSVRTNKIEFQTLLQIKVFSDFKRQNSFYEKINCSKYVLDIQDNRFFNWISLLNYYTHSKTSFENLPK